MDTDAVEAEATSSPPEGMEVEADVRDLAGGALVNFVGGLGRLSRGAFIWVITLLCGLEIQGLYSLSWGIVTTLNKVARFGLQRGVVHYVVAARSAGDKAGAERAVAAALRIGLLVGVVVAALSALSAERLAAFYQQPIAAPLRVMAWSAPLLGVAWIFLGSIRALRIMRFDVYVLSIAGPLILLVGGLAVGLAGLGLEGIAWVQLGMATGCCVLSAHYFRRFFALGSCLRQLREEVPWNAMSRFALPVMLTDLIYSGLTQLDVLMLGWFAPARAVGLYALARRMASVMLKAPKAFDPIFSSIVSELSHRERHEDLGHRFVVISRWILMVNLPIFTCILISGDSLLELLGGSKIQNGSELEIGLKILFILCAGMMVQGLFAVVEPLLAMSGRPQLNLLNNSAWLAANFGLNMWLIERYGLVGAAWGATLAMLLVNGVRLLEVYFIHHIRPFRRSQLKPLGAALAGGALGWWAREPFASGSGEALGAALGVFAGTYLLCLRLLGLEAEDRVLLRRIGARCGRMWAQWRA